VQNEFPPNTYIDISEHLEAKLNAMAIYRSQGGNFAQARSLQAMRALVKFRGATVNVCATEAFYLIPEIK